MPTTHILKPANKRFYSAVENEAFCLRLAAAVKLAAAECSIGKAEDVEYLLVKRYGRPVRSGRVRRSNDTSPAPAAACCRTSRLIPKTNRRKTSRRLRPGKFPDSRD
ncbi:HipA domain-containing protein [Bradyrhizobium sp. BEA-2-5]|uniref:HipA domain-containing protein n=1 Tax=Bradyrhizobium sp. BEA-2-5 TaxID=3080015 RepID=UPI00293EF4EF|nr:HipA domain-containing protein [Bradyrhizobium sp. BEA-2-5]WOH80345.1 HipA domain-containing protein [Bradyrhizobium sp. BEA-2-5]